MVRRLLFFLVAALPAVVTVWASSADDSYTRLARLSYLQGSVSFQHTSEADWAAASINLPLSPGDRIYAFSQTSLEKRGAPSSHS
jgi:hypothetical protein